MPAGYQVADYLVLDECISLSKPNELPLCKILEVVLYIQVLGCIRGRINLTDSGPRLFDAWGFQLDLNPCDIGLSNGAHRPVTPVGMPRRRNRPTGVLP